MMVDSLEAAGLTVETRDTGPADVEGDAAARIAELDRVMVVTGAFVLAAAVAEVSVAAGRIAAEFRVMVVTGELSVV